MTTFSMGPMKKPRIMNKHGSKINEDSHDKDVTGSSKTKKRKLSDMLGSQWSKEELKRFYKAYRKYGKNWKKVAGAIRSKSSEMAEALYNINRAYLSLPEDQGTADAFVAMMTDHHNILAIRDNEQQNIDALRPRSKAQKHNCEDLLVDILGGSRRHPVRKRTPRVPIQLMHATDDDNVSLSPNNEVSKYEVNSANGGDAVGLALAGTSQKGGSPHALRAPGRRTDNRSCSPLLLLERRPRRYAEPDLAKTKDINVGVDVICLNGGLGNREAGNRSSARDFRRFNSEGSHAKETKWRKFQEKRVTSSGCELHQNKDAKKACSGNEGEFSFLYDLHTLADTAVRFLTPTTSSELESSVHAIEEKGSAHASQKSKVLRASSMDQEGDWRQGSAVQGKALSFKNDFSRENQQKCKLINKIKKIKKSLQAKVSGENTKNSSGRQLIPLSKQTNLDQTLECASLDRRRIEMGSATSASLVPTLKMPTKTRSRRKMGLQKSIVQNKLKTSMSTERQCSNEESSPADNKADAIKEKLSNCLSSPLLRRWCSFEWFYSAIDYPWFSKREFVNYLKHVRLGHVARLSRPEWSTIRSSLGKPRRFSNTFLLEERKKLEQYRESVRTYYAELRSGVREGLPSDLAHPLSVGQHVIARHPKIGEIHDGSILTIDHNRFRVQFNSSDLGVQFVKDVDCMPLNPWENLPADLRNQDTLVELGNSYTDENYLFASSKYLPTAMFNHKEIQAKEAEIRALVEMYTALEKKEALVAEWRHMNDELFGEKGGNLIDDFGQFQKQYDMVLSQLSGVSAQVKSCRCYSRQHNTYSGNSRAPWFNSAQHSAPPADFFSNYDLGQVVEIVETSRQEARTMVAATFLEISSLEKREDAFAKIGETLHSVSYPHFGVNPRSLNNSCTHPNSSGTFKSERVHAPRQKVHLSSHAKEGQIPSELISDCVAIFLMIQACVEGRHPPAVAVEILEHALASLQPCCPNNLPIYQEIETCMGYIKTQMLARVPAPSSDMSTEVSV